MLHRFSKLLIFVLAVCTLTNFASAEEIPSIRTTTADPFSSCGLLKKNLPRDINKIRAIAKLQSKKVESCADYAGEPPENCTAHLLTFSGLDLTVLDFESEATPVAATISNAKWNLLGKVRVGQKTEVLEKHYGVKIPQNISPVELRGECAPIIVWHSGGRVTKVSLPCHACD